MKVNYNSETITLPDFLIVGAPRAGTTMLYESLLLNQNIFMPIEKEPMFFYNWEKPLHKYYSPRVEETFWVVNSLDNYLTLFKKSKSNQIIGEASTWYLKHHEIVIKNIKKIYKEKFNDLKIIIMLRNPVERIWSHYLKKYSEYRETLSFNEAVSKKVMEQRKSDYFVPSYHYFEFSFYSEPVKAYLDNFKNVKVYFFEEMVEDIDNYLEDVCDFLKIEYSSEMNLKRKVNVGGIPKNSFYNFLNSILFKDSIFKKMAKLLITDSKRNEMKLKLKSHLIKKEQFPLREKIKLAEVFKDDIKKLEHILNRELNIWKIKN